MESLQNQTNIDSQNQNENITPQEHKYKSVDNYVSVFNHEFLGLLQTRLNSLFVNIFF